MSTRFFLFSVLLVLALKSPVAAQGLLPIYSSDPVQRARQLAVTSENLRALRGDWQRFWFLDRPSMMTPYPAYGGVGSLAGPSAPRGRGIVRRQPALGGRGAIVAAPPARRSFPSGRVANNRLAGQPFGSSKKPQKTKANETQEMISYFIRGEKALAEGKTGVAKIYFNIVVKYAPPELKALAQAELDTIAAQAS